MPPLHLMQLKLMPWLYSMLTAPAEAENKVNGDVVLRPKLMNITVGIRIAIAKLMEGKTP